MMDCSLRLISAFDTKLIQPVAGVHILGNTDLVDDGLNWAPYPNLYVKILTPPYISACTMCRDGVFKEAIELK